MPRPGDIYFCERVVGDRTSNHWWVLLYVDADVVLYMTATSRITPFVYGGIFGKVLWKPRRYPDSAVFLDVNKVVDLNGSPIFPKPTVLNCCGSLDSIVLEEFDLRVGHSQLRKEGRLPNQYLAQIIPSVCCCPSARRKLSVDMIKQVLDKQYGIGGCIDAFYSNLR